MSSALHKRLQRLEELVAARVAPPVWKWLGTERMEGAAKPGVQYWRWATKEEALAHGVEVIDTPAGHVDPNTHSWVRDDRPTPQLPAPPEMKLLPAPSEPPRPQPTKPDPPDPGKRGPLTGEQLRRLLEDRERPFGRPIKYPVVGLV